MLPYVPMCNLSHPLHLNLTIQIFVHRLHLQFTELPYSIQLVMPFRPWTDPLARHPSQTARMSQQIQLMDRLRKAKRYAKFILQRALFAAWFEAMLFEFPETRIRYPGHLVTVMVPMRRQPHVDTDDEVLGNHDD